MNGTWQSAPGVYLAPGVDHDVRASVYPSGYYYCPFITSEAQGINVTFAALFDNDVEPRFTAGPVASLEWSTEAPHLTWVVTDNYLPAPTWTEYRNGTYFSNGTWTSGTALDVDIYALIMQGQASLGVHNFTIYVDDGHAGVAVNSSLVEIYNVNPQKLSAPPDADMEIVAQAVKKLQHEVREYGVAKGEGEEFDDSTFL